MNKFIKNFSLDLAWLWLCLFIVISSIFYYIYQTDLYSLVLSLILSYLPIKWLMKEKTQENEQKSFKFKDKKLIFILFLLFSFFSFSILFLFQTDKSILSPWQVIPNYFFVLYFISIFLSLIFLKNYKNSVYQKICLFLVAFLSFSIAIIVYKIGYGYDPFVHQASIYHIIDNGFMLPKNLFYIGQYNLIIALNQFFALPVSILNKIIVPFFAALILPIFSFNFLKKIVNNQEEKSNISLAIIFSLILGFSIFIISTPQNLAYIFLLVTILFNLKKQSLPYGLFSSLATFFIHPIAGIPAILFTLVFLSKKIIKKENYQKTIANLIIFSTIFLMPLSLIIGAKASFNWQINFSNFQLFYQNQENIFLNFSYFFINNYYLFIFLIIILAIFYLRKTSYYKIINNNIKMILALLLATFVSSFLNWQDLINYEQSDYTRRLIIISIIFTIPIFWFFIIKIISLIKKKNTLIYLLFFSFLITVSLYASYPRFDNYHNSRAYSISSDDIKAVNLINDWAKSDYIVLANQQLGVSALLEFGFDNYFDTKSGPIFFYSVPTGGPLYQYYLKMVYESPSFENIKKAMNLANVNTAFLIINDYWWASEKIIKEAKISANDYREINNGKVYIFKYSK